MDQFYNSVGGLLGYQLLSLKTIVSNLAASSEEGRSEEGSDAPIYHMPRGLDLASPEQRGAAVKAVAMGLQALPHMAEIYPLGGRPGLASLSALPARGGGMLVARMSCAATRQDVSMDLRLACLRSADAADAEVRHVVTCMPVKQVQTVPTARLHDCRISHRCGAGAGDRLGLKCDLTGECVPAAVLPYCGRTLLEGLVRDVQVRAATKEYAFPGAVPCTRLHCNGVHAPRLSIWSQQKVRLVPQYEVGKGCSCVHCSG